MSAITRLSCAFLNTCSDMQTQGDEYLNGLALLKASAVVLGKIKNCSGSVAAAKVNGFVISALEKLDCKKNDAGISTARAILFIAVKRNLCNKLPILISEIEKEAASRQNIITLVLDCALPPQECFIESLKKFYGENYGAKEVLVKVNVIESLISGYRVTLNTDRHDYSLQRKLQQLENLLVNA